MHMENLFLFIFFLLAKSFQYLTGILLNRYYKRANLLRNKL